MHYEEKGMLSSGNPSPSQHRSGLNTLALGSSTQSGIGSKSQKPPTGTGTSGSFLANPVPETVSKTLKRADKFIRNSAKDLAAVLIPGQPSLESLGGQHNKTEEAAKTDRTLVVSQLGKSDVEKRAESTQSKKPADRDKGVIEPNEKEPTSKSDASKLVPGDVSNQTLGNSTDNSVLHNNSKTSPTNARKERSLSEKTRKFDRNTSNDVKSPVPTPAPLNTGGRNSSVKGNSNAPLPGAVDTVQWATASQSSYTKKHKKYNPESSGSSGTLASLGATSQSFYGTVGHVMTGKKGASSSVNTPASPNPLPSAGLQTAAQVHPTPAAATASSRAVGGKPQAERTPDTSFLASNPKQTTSQGASAGKPQTEQKGTQGKGLSIYERGEVLANCSIYMRVIKGAAKEDPSSTQGGPTAGKSGHSTAATVASGGQQSGGTGATPGGNTASAGVGGSSVLSTSGATALVNSNHLKAKKRR